MESMLKKLSQCGNCGNKTSTMWKLRQQNFHNVESMLTKLPQCGKYANKTSIMWKLNNKHYDQNRPFKSQID